MKFDALLVVDVQTALVEAEPYRRAAFLEEVGGLIRCCRACGIPVIYLQHDGGLGDELEAGTPGWAIWPGIAPAPGETVVDKRWNSAFRQTGLGQLLESRGARRLILCGMQTEHCIDATCKSAFERGYDVTIAQGATTTFDGDFFTGETLTRYYEEKIWDGRYARVVPLWQLLREIEAG